MSITIQKEYNNARPFLRQNPVGVLSTVNSKNQPHAAVVYFTTDNSGNIYILTKTDTQKATNMRHNNHVMLLVYEASSQTSVQISGTATEITDLIEVNRIFVDVINISLDVAGTDIHPLTQVEAGAYVAFKLRPEVIRVAVFNKPSSGSYADLFKTKVQ